MDPMTADDPQDQKDVQRALEVLDRIRSGLEQTHSLMEVAEELGVKID